MFTRLRARKRELLEEEVRLDEQIAQLTLYGSRTGNCRLTPLFPDEFGRVAGLTDEWIEWDRITWTWRTGYKFLNGFVKTHPDGFYYYFPFGFSVKV